MALQLTAEGPVCRAPIQTSEREIERFVRENESWIRKQLLKQEKQQAALDASEPLTAGDIQRLADEALRVIPERVRYYAEKIGVTYGRITIRNQRTKWGSCSSSGNLNFNCLLMLTPPEVLDSIVVHELCHRIEMNHSARFYEAVLRAYPDYRKWNRWLKENGPLLMLRMLKGQET